MEVFGSLDSKDGSGKLKKGAEFPQEQSAKDGDLFVLVLPEAREVLYIRNSGAWTKVLLDGDEVDAGTY